MKIVIIYLFLISVSISSAEQSEFSKQPVLKWENSPLKLERGISNLVFRFVNASEFVFETDKWVPQRGKHDFPNVVVWAKRVESGHQIQALEPFVSVGQIPKGKKKIQPNEFELISADVLVPLEDGLYLIWGELRCDRSIKSERIRVRVEGGKTIPRELK